jgi:hypothetical protein
MKKDVCSLCNQKMDIHTTVHKTKPYVDGNLYPKMCFTCYHVPKIIDQTYNKEGLVKEEIDLPYSCENLHSAKELFYMGSADTLSQAKKSVASVTEACSKSVKKESLRRPNASWEIK